MKNFSLIRQISAISAVAAFGIAAGQAATIFSDNFDGSNTDLNGASPDTRPGSETWISGNLNQDGSVRSTSLASYLPYTSFANDTVYTLTLVVDIATGSSTEGHLFFTSLDPIVTNNPESSTDQTQTAFSVGRDGKYYFKNYSNNSWNDATDLANSSAGDLFNTAQSDYEIKMVLTTSSTVNWTMDGFMGGNQVDLDSGSAGLSYDFGPTAPSFTGIGLQMNSSTYNVDSIELSVIPEPSSAALLLGTLGLLGLRRRR